MKTKPIIIRPSVKEKGAYTVHVRINASPKCACGTSPCPGHIVCVERLISGKSTYGRLNAEPQTFTYPKAVTMAHLIGRYKLGLGDFIYTYVEGLQEE